jgi:hypothetical protein
LGRKLETVKILNLAMLQLRKTELLPSEDLFLEVKKYTKTKNVNFFAMNMEF